MHRLALPVILFLLAPFADLAAAQEQGNASGPRLDYHMDAYQDAYATYGEQYTGYHGRWSGTWTGDDGRRYSGTWEGNFNGRTEGREPDRSAATVHEQPDPAFYGSGQVVGGWYYPPPVVTRTVVDYRPAR